MQRFIVVRACALAGALVAPLPASAHDASAAVASPRATFNFNPDWRSTTGEQANAQAPAFDDRAWRRVTLPNAFNEREAFARDI